MNYEEFKQKILKEFKSYLPEKYKDYRVDSFKVEKVNVVLDSLSVLPKEKDESTLMPTFYINYLYEEYLKNTDFNAVIKNAAQDWVKAVDRQAFGSIKDIFKGFENKIVFTLVNKAQNKKLLEKIPNREFMDLAIIYRLAISNESGCFQSSIINNILAERLGVTEDRLFELAKVNTKKLLGIRIEPLQAMITKMAGFNVAGDNPEIIVVTNNIGVNGASVIFYEETMKNVAEFLGDRFYILPSSIHECICVKADNSIKRDNLKELVKTINQEQVAIEDRLGDEVYLWDRGNFKV